MRKFIGCLFVNPTELSLLLIFFAYNIDQLAYGWFIYGIRKIYKILSPNFKYRHKSMFPISQFYNWMFLFLEIWKYERMLNKTKIYKLTKAYKEEHFASLPCISVVEL